MGKPEMTKDFDIDITPSVTTYELYQIASYTHWFSIGEFIDNSITSAVNNWPALKKRYGKNNSLKISIELDHDNSAILISDNAAGIDKSELQRALRAGEPPANRSLLSVHGVGMKMSAFWLGRNLNIKTWPLNVDEGYELEVDLDEIKRTKSAKSPVRVIEGQEQSGTIVRISKISDEKWPMGRGQGKLRTLLASMYRIYLNNEEFPVQIIFNGKELKFDQMKILEAKYWPNTQGPDESSNLIYWEKEFSFVTGRGRRISGRIGLLEKMSRDLSGIFLHYKGKGMGGIGSGDSKDAEFSTSELKDNREYYRPAAIFGQEGSYRYQRFTGEFDISELGKTSSTDSIKWNEDEQQEFLEALAIFLKNPELNMWSMAENYQIRKAKKMLEEDSRKSEIEFSLNEISEIAEKFLDSIRPEVISHVESEIENTNKDSNTEISLVPEDEFLISESSWRVRDASGHLHSITPQFIEDARLNLYDLVSTDQTNHELRINIGHPFVRRFQWGNRDVRLALIAMIYLMAIPEVLLPIRVSPGAFRRKIFEILDSTLQITNGQD
jgi:hypothetical protein